MGGIILKLIGWQGIVGIVVGVILSGMLVAQKFETRHWHKQSDQYMKLYRGEQVAFAQTVADYRAKAAQAKVDDQANVNRVIAEQQSINARSSQTYEERIADARARADRLQQQLTTPAHPGGSGATPVSPSNAAPGGTTGTPPQAGLSSSDALIATEQAIQLDEIIKWVNSLTKIDRTGRPSSGSQLQSPTGNR